MELLAEDHEKTASSMIVDLAYGWGAGTLLFSVVMQPSAPKIILSLMISLTDYSLNCTIPGTTQSRNEGLILEGVGTCDTNYIFSQHHLRIFYPVGGIWIPSVRKIQWSRK